MVETIDSDENKDLRQNESFSLFKKLEPIISLKVLELVKSYNKTFNKKYIIIKYKDTFTWLTKEEYEKGN